MATVRRCIDCDVVLVDEVATTDVSPDDAVSVGEPVGAGDQIGYELDGWGNQLKVTLEGMLERAGIGRVWEAGALVVAAADEDAVDDLIATLEGGDVDDLDDDVVRVALEIEGLDADGHDELDARLLADGIVHAWDDEGALVVAEDDEERVLAIIDDALDPDGPAGDGLAAHEALSAVYVAVDRLAKHPTDPKLAQAYRSATDGLAELATPYGFTAADWAELGDDARSLADLVAPPSADVDGDGGDGGADPDTDAKSDTETETEAGDDASAEVAVGEDARAAALSLRARLVELV